MIRIAVPQIFENMEEATVGKWLQQEGAQVAPGDALCELITEKTTLDLPAENAGTLVALLVPEKSVVPAGFIIGLIEEAGQTGGGGPQGAGVAAEKELALQFNQQLMAKRGETTGADRESAPHLQVPAVSAAPARVAPATAPAASGVPAAENGGAGARIRATPAARRAARDSGVDLQDVAAKYPGKVLGEEDVKAFLAQ